MLAQTAKKIIWSHVDGRDGCNWCSLTVLLLITWKTLGYFYFHELSYVYRRCSIEYEENNLESSLPELICGDSAPSISCAYLPWSAAECWQKWRSCNVVRQRGPTYSANGSSAMRKKKKLTLRDDGWKKVNR